MHLSMAVSAQHGYTFFKFFFEDARLSSEYKVREISFLSGWVKVVKVKAAWFYLAADNTAFSIKYIPDSLGLHLLAFVNTLAFIRRFTVGAKCFLGTRFALIVYPIGTAAVKIELGTRLLFSALAARKQIGGLFGMSLTATFKYFR